MILNLRPNQFFTQRCGLVDRSTVTIVQLVLYKSRYIHNLSVTVKEKSYVGLSER